MNPQQAPPLDSKRIGEILTNMKKQMAQVDGEMTMMKNDATSSLFQGFSNIIGQVYNDKEGLQAKLDAQTKTLDEIYQGHPDIKVSMESKEKEAKNKPKVAKSTK